MVLNDFLPLIQLAAGLNAAYIVVGISQGYAQILLNKIFNISEQIQSRFEPVKATIKINQETLNHMEPSDVNGKNTNTQIEGVKREYEKLAKKIDDTEKELENDAGLICEFRCFSGLSLMIFLYCCTLLLVAPLYSTWFLLPFVLLVFIHSMIGWFFEKSKCVCKLIWVIWEYLIILVLSVICCIACKYQVCEDLDNLLIIVSALLPMINFVIFFIKSLSKMKTIQTNIVTREKNIEDEGNVIHGKFNLLQSLETLKMDM